MSETPAGTAGLLQSYLDDVGRRPGERPQAAPTAYYAALDAVAAVSPGIAGAIVRELADQRHNLKLIASENFCSLAVQLAHGNLLTDKYAEGYPGHRFYAGCDNVDAIESEAAALARELFGADHAYVQPHSGADANLVAFLSILSARVERPLADELGEKNLVKIAPADWQRIRAAFTGQRLLAMDYYSGGHLTHGYRYNVSSLLFEAHGYSVDRQTGLLDLDRLHAQVREVRPLILLAGYSAYPRKIDFARLREMADEVGAVLMVDMAHFAGLVAGKVFRGDYDPVPFAHVVTSTTHKTLRGPRGGLVLCQKEFAEWVDKGCPTVLGGPLPHAMAAKAVAFREALRPEFQRYAQRIVDNARELAAALLAEGLRVVTGDTENHLVLVDVSRLGLTGRQAESALRECRLTLNRNSLPFDPNGPWYTSGLRLGTPAATSLGMGAAEMREIAAIMRLVLTHTTPETLAAGAKAGERSQARYTLDPAAAEQARGRVSDLLARHPVYPELDLGLMLAAPWLQPAQAAQPAQALRTAQPAAGPAAAAAQAAPGS
ncbi:MAG TPA: glycine hydroxymethyltransferase [Thermoanaerobaculia bacterium]|nr:glycine hydroxymethyltransferase [Thermoanaerobaculia bacterium]